MPQASNVPTQVHVVANPICVDVKQARTVALSKDIHAADTVVHIVTDAVAVHISHTHTSTHANGVKLAAVAIAVAGRNVVAATLVDFTRAVANAASVKRADAGVHVVADAVAIGVSSASTTTHTQGVELVATTIAVTGRDVRTATLVDFARTVADATGVKRTHAGVHVVADAVAIGVSCASATTHAQGVKLVAIAVAVAGRDVRTTTLVDLARTVADAAQASSVPTQVSSSSQMPSPSASGEQAPPHTPVRCHHNRSRRPECRTSALVDVAGSVADAASVERTNAGVHVVADAVAIGVSSASATTHAQGVELVATTIAVASGDVRTATLVDLAGMSPGPFADAVTGVTHAQRTGCPRRRTQMPSPSVSTSSQMPSWSRTPPHTPKASSWLPPQSQSPAGMFAQPHS